MSEQEVKAAPVGRGLGADLIIPALAAGLTIYFFVDSAELVWEAKANGTVIGVTLLALIAAQAARVLAQVRAGTGTLGLGEFARLSPVQWQRLIVLAILIAFVATVPWLGTTLGLFLTMTALMWVLGVRDPRMLLGIAAVTASLVYLLFIALLKTQLPAGFIENMLKPLFGAG